MSNTNVFTYNNQNYVLVEVEGSKEKQCSNCVFFSDDTEGRGCNDAKMQFNSCWMRPNTFWIKQEVKTKK